MLAGSAHACYNIYASLHAAPCADNPNAASECTGWKKSGYCDPRYVVQWQSISQVWCPMTCGTCSSDGSTPATVGE